MTDSANPSGSNLTDLPSAVQAHILQSLGSPPQPPPSIAIDIDSARNLHTPLPADLLSTAQTSTQLAAATAEALGQRAAYLNLTIAGDLLPQWITALAPAIKAVSTFDHSFARKENLTGFDYEPQSFFDRRCRHALNVFDALVSDRVALQVLDLSDIPFHRSLHMADEVTTNLSRVLASNASSLRELALPAIPLCAAALQQSSLPNLNVVQFQYKNAFNTNQDDGTDPRQEAFTRMLRALDGHADRENNLTTVAELRLVSVSGSPLRPVNDSECSSAFFNSISTLRLRGAGTQTMTGGKVSSFVALFPNLKNLHWNGDPDRKSFEMITRECSHLEQLHVEGAQAFPDLTTGEIFTAAQGKLRTLMCSAVLSAEQLKMLADNNPNIVNVGMWVDPRNLDCLTTFLADCRQIKKLDLGLGPDCGENLGADGWRSLSKLVRSASEELQEVCYQVGDESEPYECDVDAMVDSIVSMAEFLGDRAKSLIFQTPTEVVEQKILVNAACRVMRCCEVHCGNLQSLKLQLFTADVDYIWGNEEEEVEKFTTLLRVRDRLLAAAPRLRYLDLGYLDIEAQEKLDGEE